jgi:hypothetical protein
MAIQRGSQTLVSLTNQKSQNKNYWINISIVKSVFINGQTKRFLMIRLPWSEYGLGFWNIYEKLKTDTFLSVHFPELSSLIQRTRPILKPSVTFCNKLISYGKKLLAPCPQPPPPQILDHHLLAVPNSLFNIIIATLHIWRSPPPSATWRCAMPWWQESVWYN